MIKVSVPITDLIWLLERQLSSFFSLNETEREVIEHQLPVVLGRVDTCLSCKVNGYMGTVGGGFLALITRLSI